MSVQILVGDALAKLRELPDQSVRCCVTSPPYWGLRDYGSCSCGSGRFDLGQGNGTGGNLNYRPAKGFDPECKHCSGSGRIKGTENQLGLEATPADYVRSMVEVFREVKRVLADDGTLWLNLGDSYARSGGKTEGVSRHWDGREADPGGQHQTRHVDNLEGLFKPKDLIGIPWRVAFGLQEDGWYLRSDIIWAKPNPMPESVTDRPTKAHEYVFLLSKSERYFYDAAAIRTVLKESSEQRLAQNVDEQNGSERVPGKTNGTMKAVRRTDKQRGHGRRHDGFNDRWDSMSREEQMEGGANARTVWEIATMPFREAHFATFPPELPRRCISAGSAIGDTILDPFGGAGTTGLVADRLNRNAILIELNPKYAQMAERRIHADAPLFADVSTSAGRSAQPHD